MPICSAYSRTSSKSLPELKSEYKIPAQKEEDEEAGGSIVCQNSVAKRPANKYAPSSACTRFFSRSQRRIWSVTVTGSNELYTALT